MTDGQPDVVDGLFFFPLQKIRGVIQPEEGPVKIADNDSNDSAFEIEFKLFDKFEATNKECKKQNLAPSFGFIFDPDQKVKNDDDEMVAKPRCIYTFGAPVIK